MRPLGAGFLRLPSSRRRSCGGACGTDYCNRRAVGAESQTEAELSVRIPEGIFFMRIPVLLLSTSLLCGPAAFAAPADDLEDAFQRLKEAQTQNDAPAVKELATQVHKLAGMAIAAPAP